MDWIKNAARSLKRKRLRTILTVLSISVGVASVVLISSIGTVGTQAIHQEINGLGIGAISVTADLLNNREDPLNNRHLAAIRTLSDVTQAEPIISKKSKVNMRGLVGDVMVWGIDCGEKQIFDLHLLHGRKLDSRDVHRQTQVCLADKHIAQDFYGRDNIVGKTVSVFLGGGWKKFEIVGVVDSGGTIMQNVVGEVVPSFLYLPYTTLQQIAGSENLDQIAISLSADTDIDRAKQRIVSLLEGLEGKSGGFQAQNVAKQKAQLDRILLIVRRVLSLIAGVSLFVAGLGVMTVMLASVSERTKEIGIKKSIGASQRDILREFLAEALLISLLGSFFGLIAGTVLSAAGCYLLGEGWLMDWPVCFTAVWVTVLIGMIFGVYPSLQAAKLDPINALRQEN